MWVRTPASAFPSFLRRITSRVMLRQMPQVAAWLVNVFPPSGCSRLM